MQQEPNMVSTSILVVEDERIVAMDLTATLRRLGYTVPATAASGDEAIQQAVKHRPDLVLMDIHLGGPMDGIEVTERICADFDVPVIYLTAHTDRETQQRARHTAPYGYLVKPFDERTLQTTIDMTIERHGRDRRARAHEQHLLMTLTSIGDAVLITDAAGRVTLLNPVAEFLLRCSPSTVIGHPVDDIMPLIDVETRVPTAWRGSGTVLVVDDEASVRSTLVQLLERLGLKVLTAPDAEYALESLQSHLNAIDCVLLDLTMPGMPSATVARRMRELSPTLPIVLMSGYSAEDIARSVQEASRMHALPKPFRLADLLEIVQQVFTMTDSSYEVGR
jgi:CheY-like chemotaxis protein